MNEENAKEIKPENMKFSVAVCLDADQPINDLVKIFQARSKPEIADAIKGVIQTYAVVISGELHLASPENRELMVDAICKLHYALGLEDESGNVPRMTYHFENLINDDTQELPAVEGGDA